MRRRELLVIVSVVALVLLRGVGVQALVLLVHRVQCDVITSRGGSLLVVRYYSLSIWHGKYHSRRRSHLASWRRYWSCGKWGRGPRVDGERVQISRWDLSGQLQQIAV